MEKYILEAGVVGQRSDLDWNGSPEDTSTMANSRPVRELGWESSRLLGDRWLLVVGGITTLKVN